MIKNNLNYFKKLVKVLIWPIIFIIGQFFLEYIFVAYYNSKNKGSLTNSEFLKYIKTTEYKEGLNSFINSKMLIITILFFIIFLPILYFLYKKYKKESKRGYLIESISLGISISIIFNILVYNINSIFNFTDRYEFKLPFIVILICTGVLGPILEEILYRGIVYNKLKEFNPNMRSIILCSVLFGLFHFDIIDGIYAFGVSFMFIYLYEKYNTLVAPILMHIFLNTTGIVMIKLGILDMHIISLLLIVISVLILLIDKKYKIKEEL